MQDASPAIFFFNLPFLPSVHNVPSKLQISYTSLSYIIFDIASHLICSNKIEGWYILQQLVMLNGVNSWQMDQSFKVMDGNLLLSSLNHHLREFVSSEASI